MLFTENRYDRSMEQMMKGIPNFYPRGSGIVVTGNFRYTANMCNCKWCEYYGGKKKGCLVPKCVCLEERISVGIASVNEIMTETMSEIKHIKHLYSCINCSYIGVCYLYHNKRLRINNRLVQTKKIYYALLWYDISFTNSYRLYCSCLKQMINTTCANSEYFFYFLW